MCRWWRRFTWWLEDRWKWRWFEDYWFIGLYILLVLVLVLMIHNITDGMADSETLQRPITEMTQGDLYWLFGILILTIFICSRDGKKGD